MEIDFRSRIPLYLQVATRIREDIDLGRLTPGERLLTVRELANLIEVNFNTVARAYRTLALLGYVTTQRGRGTYVLPASERSYQEAKRLTVLQEMARRYVEQAKFAGFKEEEIERSLQEVLAL